MYGYNGRMFDQRHAARLLAYGIVSAWLVLGPVTVSAAWTADTYPNPATNHTACGVNKAGWVCDPDNMITQDQVDALNAGLQKIRNLKDVCLCESYCPGSTLAVGVAFIDDTAFENEIFDNARKKAVTDFASKLLSKWSAHQLGECMNNAMIVVAKTKYPEGAFSVGSAAAKVLKDACIKEIEEAGNEQTKRGGYYNGSHAMIKEIHDILEKGHDYDCKAKADDKDNNKFSWNNFRLYAYIGGAVVGIIFGGIACYCRMQRYKMLRDQRSRTCGAPVPAVTYQTGQHGGQAAVASTGQSLSPGYLPPPAAPSPFPSSVKYPRQPNPVFSSPPPAYPGYDNPALNPS